MNEQRREAYLNLIQSLLSCPSGEEPKILTANQELLDPGFLEMVEAETRMLSQEGDENTANWLKGLANYLKEALNLDTEAQNLENAITAYNQVLTFLTKEASPQQWAMTQYNLANTYIRRIWGERAQNLENAITAYSQVLTVFTKEAFPQQWATTQYNLANTYISRIWGERAQNLENAITAYSQVLTVLTKEAFPQQWAMTQYNLAIAYSDRIRGERAQNIEKAITAFNQALTVRTKEAFPQQWAMTENNLAIAYSERILGERAQNIEKAITAYNQVLTVRTKEAFPQDWAQTQINLAVAYSERIRGEKAQNIEKAITAYNQVLTVLTKEAFPQDWAITQMNLANSYGKRIRGERAQNIENAITACNQALTVLTKEAFPQDWALTQMNLANSYGERIRGERAQNIEKAITACNQALTVLTKEAFPQDWAMTQINLATDYGKRIWGDRAQNLENAIAAYNRALTVYTREAFPQDWAMTQNNLAINYSDRIWGDRAQNLENAITAYNQALTVRTKEAFPQQWAMTQNNLAGTYCDRIWGDKAQNIEKAITACNQALTVRTKEAFPQDWAQTQYNLANAYSKRIRGERAQNLENAIAAYNQALTVYTKKAFPQDWAMTQNNLAINYSDRIWGDRAQNLENAITACKQALTVLTKEAFPQNWVQTQHNLANAYRDGNQFISAYNTLKSAIATIESLREEIVSGEESKRKQAERFNVVYSRMVEVCLELDNITEAIEYVERSKTRNLVEQILERDSKTFFPPEVFTQLETYRDEIAVGQFQIQNGKAENPQKLAQHLQELRQQRNELQNKYLPVGYGFNFDSFQPTLDEGTAILEWYILDNKILAFIITQKGEVKVWQSQPEDRESLGNWGDQYLQNYYNYNQKDQWQNKLGEELKKLASILHIDEILNQIPNHCDKIILVPHTVLHLFPLHALPVTSQNNQDSCCLLDVFSGGVSYAPSCQLLQQLQQRECPDFESLFAIQNPTEDLKYTDLEVETILSYFPSHQVLPKKQATKAALSQATTQLKQANYIHFSCHGSFNINSPQNSYLLLADAHVSPIPDDKPEKYVKVSEDEAVDLTKCLTLGNLFERTFDFSQTRLVVLSACETGLVDFNNTSDEYISLPSGFLYAGSSSVVSSLWTVNDLSTSLLMIKFIQNLQAVRDISVPLAMNQAQQWLRDASVEDLLKWSKESQLNQNIQQEIQEELELHNPNEKYFSSPFHWAAFCAIGQ